MALELPALIQKFVLDTSGVSKGIQSAEADVKKSSAGMAAAAEDGAKKSSASLDRFMDKTGKVGMSMTKFVTAPILGAGVVAFKFASDLGESMSKVSVVFGKNAKDIESWSKTAASSLGISQQKALEAAGTFGNLFRAMGLGLPAATEMSQKIIGLSSDLASFNNANPEEVLIALRAGLVGETEPLRKFGVNINQARIEAEAFALGLAKPVKNAPLIAKAHLDVSRATKELTKAQKTHGEGSAQAVDAAAKLATAQGRLDKALQGSNVELTAAQKAQASYSIIMKDTSLAQGDFDRTSEGAANKSRILKAQMEDLAAGIGTKLLPAGTKLLSWASDLVGGFNKIPSGAQTIIVAFAGVAAATGPLLVGGSKLYKAYQDLSPMFIKVATKLGILVPANAALAASEASVTAATHSMNTAFLANPIFLIVAAVVALGAAFFLAYKKIEPFRNFIDGLWDKVQAAGSAIVDFFKQIRGAFVMPDFARTNIAGQIGTSLRKAWDVIKPIIGGIKQTIGVLFTGDFKGGGPFAEDSPFISALFTFREIVGKVLGVVKAVVTTAFTVIGKVIGFVADHWKAFAFGAAVLFAPVLAAIYLLVKNFDTIKTVVTTVFTVVGTIIGFVWNTILKPIFGVLVAVIQTVIQIVQHWGNIVGEVFGVIGTVASTLWNSVLKPVFGFVVDFIKAYLIVTFTIWKTVAETVFKAIGAVASWLWDSVLSPTFNFIKAAIETVVIPIFNVYRNVAETVFRAVATVAQWLWNNILQPTFNTMKTFIENTVLPVFRTIGSVFKTAFEGVASVASTVWEKIKGVFSSGLSVLGDVVGGFLKIVSGIARAVGATSLADSLKGAANDAYGWGATKGKEAGGTVPKGFARGTGMMPTKEVGAGWITPGARAIVGEGRPAYPEYVIPTDPQYRKRAQGLASDLWGKLGMEYAAGGRLWARTPAHGVGDVVGGAWDATGGKAVSAVADAAGATIKWVRGQAGKAVSAAWPMLATTGGLGAGVAGGAMNSIRQAVIDFIQGAENKQLAKEMGDLVAVTKNMIAMFGVRASGHPAFGGMPAKGIHSENSYHYKGRAVDMNYGPGGESSAEKAQLDKVYAYIKQHVTKYQELLWKVAGHFDHLHLAMDKGGMMNPHVRDKGGPLLPGYTYNGTGTREWVAERPPKLSVGASTPMGRFGVTVGSQGVNAYGPGGSLSAQRDGDTITINVETDADAQDIASEIMFQKRIRNR